MTTIEYLELNYNHSFDMVKYGETKNATLIVFNGAIIVGMIKIINDTQVPYLSYFLFYIIAMCGISIFISFSALIAKVKNSINNRPFPSEDLSLFFATFARMRPDDLIRKLKTEYDCEPSNTNYEMDLARQVIITSQIALRKFKFFNIAIAFTLAGLLTPISILVYKGFIHRAFLDYD